MRPLLLALMIGLIGLPAWADGPALPKAYKDYMVDPDTLSPDKQYGFIYPSTGSDDENAKIKNFLVALKPFRVVVEIPAGGDGFFANENHASFAAAWAKDNSAVLVIEGSRWGPGTVYVVPLDHGKPGKIAELTALITPLAEPEYKKSGADPYNDGYHFVFDGDGATGWTINAHGQVLIDCKLTTNPKGDPDTASWDGNFKGTWDIAQGKFIAQKLTTTFSGTHKEQ